MAIAKRFSKTTRAAKSVAGTLKAIVQDVKELAVRKTSRKRATKKTAKTRAKRKA